MNMIVYSVLRAQNSLASGALLQTPLTRDHITPMVSRLVSYFSLSAFCVHGFGKLYTTNFCWPKKRNCRRQSKRPHTSKCTGPSKSIRLYQCP